jgi:hypothetical protein
MKYLAEKDTLYPRMPGDRESKRELELNEIAETLPSAQSKKG